MKIYKIELFDPVALQCYTESLNRFSSKKIVRLQRDCCVRITRARESNVFWRGRPYRTARFRCPSLPVLWVSISVLRMNRHSRDELVLTERYSLSCFEFMRYYIYIVSIVTPWRNGSASDSRSEGCVFKSRRGQWVRFGGVWCEISCAQTELRADFANSGSLHTN